MQDWAEQMEKPDASIPNSPTSTSPLDDDMDDIEDLKTEFLTSLDFEEIHLNLDHPLHTELLNYIQLNNGELENPLHWQKALWDWKGNHQNLSGSELAVLMAARPEDDD